MMASIARSTCRVLYILTAIFLIMLALSIVAVRVGLPLLAKQKSTVEAQLSERLQNPVEIGNLSLQWEGLDPLLRVGDVNLIRSEDQIVSFDEVLLDVNLTESLLSQTPIINELRLVGAEIDIDIDGIGSQLANGFSPNGSDTAAKEFAEAGNGKSVIAWLFNTQRVAFLDTRLTLIDTDRNQQYTFEDIDVRAEKLEKFHQIRLDASLPASIGGSLSAGFDVSSETAELATSNGDMHLSVAGVGWAGLQQALKHSGIASLPELNTESTLALDATADLELSGRWENGELVKLHGPLSIEDISERNASHELIDSASAQFSYTRSDNSMQIVIADIAIHHESEELVFNEIRLDRSLGVLPVTSSAEHQATFLTDSSNALPEPASGEVSESLPHQLPVTPQIVQTRPVVEVPSANTEDKPAAGVAVPGKLLARLLSGSASNNNLPWQLNATADALQVNVMLQLLKGGLLPLSDELSNLLPGSESEGLFENVHIAIQHTDEQHPEEVSVSASVDIKELAFSAQDSALSFGPIDGALVLNDHTAELVLSAFDMPLVIKELTDSVLNLDQMDITTTIDFSRLNNIQVMSDVHLADAGIDFNTRLGAKFLSNESPLLDIKSDFSVDDLEAIKLWWPRNKLSAAASRWIDRSIKSGSARQGSLLFSGHVADFPFSEGEGVFNASAQINDGVLEFLPTWPAVNNINGKLEFDGLSLTGKAAKAVIEDFSISTMRVEIDNITAPVVEFSSTGSGVFNDVVNFGVNGPLGFILEPIISDMSGTGDAEMDLELVVPLYGKPADGAVGLFARTWQPFSVSGTLFLNDNDVTYERAGLTLANARGGVAFSHNGIAIRALKGQLLEHDVRITGETQGIGSNANTIINVDGALEANDLLAHYGNTLDQFVRGTSQWSISVNAPHSTQRLADEGVSLSVSSNLLGTRLLLPAPFNKSSAREQDFSLTTAFRTSSEEQQWNLTYGDELRTYVSFKDQVLYSMLLEIGNNLATDPSEWLDQPGVRIEGETEQLAADDWILTLAAYIDSLPSTSGAPQPILPISGSISTTAMILGNTNFGKASLQASTNDTYLDLAIANQSLKGNLSYPRTHWQKDLAMQSQIELLDWSVFDALSAEDNSDDFGSSTRDGLDPRLLPPVVISVASLTRGDFHLQDLVLRAEPDISGLDITTLGFAYDTMRLVGQGYWHLRDPQGVNPSLAGKQFTELDFVLQSNDFGVGLAKLGLDGVIDEGQGSIEIKLGWPAPIYLPSITDLEGTINIDLQSGSIVPLEPGAGRVVGLFAFQALPRRLDLDFKDLTRDGLAFRSVSGTIDIEDGIAQVPLLQLTGPIGVVDIIGKSDLTTQQFDQVVTVLPRVSAALPIIGAITGGASAGIGTLVATGIFKALGIDFDRIGLRTFSLTGDWASPQFSPVASDIFGRSQ